MRLLRMFWPHFSGHGHYTHRWQRKVYSVVKILFVISILTNCYAFSSVYISNFEDFIPSTFQISSLLSLIVLSYCVFCNNSFIRNSLNS